VLGCRERAKGEAVKIHFDDLQGEKMWIAMRALSTGVTTNVMHPGGLGKGAGGPFGVMLRPEKGAETLVHLASAPELEGVTGRYYVKNKPAKSSARSQDPALAARLWKVSAELAGVPA
jgi:hypothetical protein